MSDIPELTSDQLESAISARRRKRLIQGKFETGEDVAALRKFVGLTQAEFARAMGISVHTLRNWEQGRRTPGLVLSVRRRKRERTGSGWFTGQLALHCAGEAQDSEVVAG